MSSVNLSGYNLNELRSLGSDVEKAIKERQQQDVQKAREQVLAIARDAGISVEDLLAARSKKPNKAGGQKVRAQYQNPKDLSQTWTGRGRKPKWVAEALAGGQKLDDFRTK